MILCRALSYEENTLDKSLLKSAICKTMLMNMVSPTANIIRMMDGAAETLTVPDGRT